MPRSKTVDAALLRSWPLPVPAGGDKNARGAVLVVGGAPQMPGAVILAATSALRAGAGKLQIGTCASIAPHVGAAVPEALVIALDETHSGAIAPSCAASIAERANRGDALAIGPGLVDERVSASLLRSVAASLVVPAVIDAGALACFAGAPDAFAQLHGRLVLTPHAGEMAAMLGRERAQIEAQPAQFSREAAQRFGAVVALKGEATYVADPDGASYCNTHGDVGLATSGSGDTLAGIIGGFLARGATPLHATVWGVYVHAEAGARLARRIGLGFLARELPAEIPLVMREV